VTNVSRHGLWILLEGSERFLAFKHFPWFRDASIGDLVHVECRSPGHLYWPKLDVDLAVESIDDPTKFPLVSRIRAKESKARGAAKKKRAPLRSARVARAARPASKRGAR
jgi:hypothetical protein